MRKLRQLKTQVQIYAMSQFGSLGSTYETQLSVYQKVPLGSTSKWREGLGTWEREKLSRDASLTTPNRLTDTLELKLELSCIGPKGQRTYTPTQSVMDVGHPWKGMTLGRQLCEAEAAWRLRSESLLLTISSKAGRPVFLWEGILVVHLSVQNVQLLRGRNQIQTQIPPETKVLSLSTISYSHLCQDTQELLRRPQVMNPESGQQDLTAPSDNRSVVSDSLQPHAL